MLSGKRWLKTLGLLLCALLVTGCTAETAKRTAFETMQNLGTMQCSPELDDGCSPRLDYQGYQEGRDKLNQGKAIKPDQTENCSMCAHPRHGTTAAD